MKKENIKIKQIQNSNKNYNVKVLFKLKKLK